MTIAEPDGLAADSFTQTESREELADRLARAVATDIKTDIDQRGSALIALSGGTTPKLFLKQLASMDLAWDRVTVTLVDERWVPETDDRSNARFIKSELLHGAAANAAFIPLYVNAATPEEGLANSLKNIADLHQGGFTAVILGMGADGHTASFFPGGDNLIEAIELNSNNLLYTMRAPDAGEPRLTFSLSALLETKALYLHIEGAEKLAVLNQARMAGPAEEFPIRAVLRQDRIPTRIFWCP